MWGCAPAGVAGEGSPKAVRQLLLGVRGDRLLLNSGCARWLAGLGRGWHFGRRAGPMARSCAVGWRRVPNCLGVPIWSRRRAARRLAGPLPGRSPAAPVMWAVQGCDSVVLQALRGRSLRGRLRGACGRERETVQRCLCRLRALRMGGRRVLSGAESQVWTTLGWSAPGARFPRRAGVQRRRWGARSGPFSGWRGG